MSEYDTDNIFARILRDEIPSDRVYEDDEFVVFRDIAPKAPTHLLVIPRGEPDTHRAPRGPADLTDDDAGWMGRMLVLAARLADEHGLAEGGYRLLFNNGPNAGQEVPHIHLHILGGGRLGPIA